MNHGIDLRDVQGNVVRGYSRFGFPKARYTLFTVTKVAGARQFLLEILDEVTTGVRWSASDEPLMAQKRPKATVNVALTYAGLEAFGLPEDALRGFPGDFAMGMRARASILGDDGPSAPENWDRVWHEPSRVHLLVTINGQTGEAIEARYQELLKKVDSCGGLEVLEGHSTDGSDAPYQEGAALEDSEGKPIAKEHFGYTDGITNPYFRGCGGHPSQVVGGGKLVRKNLFSKKLFWEPLETGEFILGHKDEAQEIPLAATPHQLTRNGTFMVFRKLEQNVDAFDSYLEDEGAHYPGGKEALAAKFAGRWRNGAPLATFPDRNDAEAAAEQWEQAKNDIVTSSTAEARAAAKDRFSEINRKFVNFNYNDDMDGGRCPLGAHVRRVNPRGALEFDQSGAFGTAGAFETPTALANRRRIIRRGLPYGGNNGNGNGKGGHGLVFMAINASIERQFEFVQQQWMNYGNDFRLANEKDPILGNHEVDDQGKPAGRMSIQATHDGSAAPHFCGRMPRFVVTRGGEYFFVPSVTALRLIGQGAVDPT